MKKQKNILGFTLIELLVVVAIIGLLTSVISVALASARIKARDARRKADIDQVRKALELYLQDNGTYPYQGAVGNPNEETDIQNLASFLAPKYMPSLPNDPKGTPKNYMYVWKQARGEEYGLLVPFGDDGGVNCQWRTPGGSKNWFDKALDCDY